MLCRDTKSITNLNTSGEVDFIKEGLTSASGREGIGMGDSIASIKDIFGSTAEPAGLEARFAW
jgi:hypothetical protein